MQRLCGSAKSRFLDIRKFLILVLVFCLALAFLLYQCRTPFPQPASLWPTDFPHASHSNLPLCQHSTSNDRGILLPKDGEAFYDDSLHDSSFSFPFLAVDNLESDCDPSILVLVHVTSKERYNRILSSWLGDLLRWSRVKVVTFSGVTDGHFVDIPLLDEVDDLARSSRAFEMIWKSFFRDGGFDFMFKADDDSIVFRQGFERTARQLQRLRFGVNASIEKPVFAGSRLDVDTYVWGSGGAGYWVSRAAYRLMIEKHEANKVLLRDFECKRAEVGIRPEDVCVSLYLNTVWNLDLIDVPGMFMHSPEQFFVDISDQIHWVTPLNAKRFLVDAQTTLHRVDSKTSLMLHATFRREIPKRVFVTDSRCGTELRKSGKFPLGINLIKIGDVESNDWSLPELQTSSEARRLSWAFYRLWNEGGVLVTKDARCSAEEIVEWIESEEVSDRDLSVDDLRGFVAAKEKSMGSWSLIRDLGFFPLIEEGNNNNFAISYVRNVIQRYPLNTAGLR